MIQITDTAARKIQSLMAKQGISEGGLRVGVKGGGCSGFSYLLDLTESQKESDEIWEFTFPVATAAKHANGSDSEGGVAVAQQGDTFTLRVICDPKSYLYLNNTTIDFRDELMGRGFVFNNPNATSSCGCGSSFSAPETR